jgi:hypothetical protein
LAPILLVSALALMYFYTSTFRSKGEVSNMAVFCSFITSWILGMVLTYFLNEFWNGSCRSNYYWYHPSFHIPHKLHFNCKVLIFQNLLSLFSNHIYVSWRC